MLLKGKVEEIKSCESCKTRFWNQEWKERNSGKSREENEGVPLCEGEKERQRPSRKLAGDLVEEGRRRCLFCYLRTVKTVFLWRVSGSWRTVEQ